MHGLVATIELLDEGSTVPFIASYRKEATGNLDEVRRGKRANLPHLPNPLHSPNSSAVIQLDVTCYYFLAKSVSRLG